MILCVHGSASQMASFRTTIKLTDLSTALLFFLQWQKLFYDFSGFFQERNANKREDDDQVLAGTQQGCKWIPDSCKNNFHFCQYFARKKRLLLCHLHFLLFQTHFQTKLLFFFGKRRRKIITDAQKTHICFCCSI